MPFLVNAQTEVLFKLNQFRVNPYHCWNGNPIGGDVLLGNEENAFLAGWDLQVQFQIHLGKQLDVDAHKHFLVNFED